MQRILITVLITLSCTFPLIAQSDKDYEDLKNEVQILREEVKDLNNSIPFRGNPDWGTGFIAGFRFCGMFGLQPVYGYELGYSWNPNWLIRADLEYYPDPSDPSDSDKENISYAAGIIGKTPLSINLRGYIGLFFGRVKPPDMKSEPFGKALIGFEFYTNKHVGLFIEIGNSIPFTDDSDYNQFYRGFAIGGIRLYF